MREGRRDTPGVVGFMSLGPDKLLERSRVSWGCGRLKLGSVKVLVVLVSVSRISSTPCTLLG